MDGNDSRRGISDRKQSERAHREQQNEADGDADLQGPLLPGCHWLEHLPFERAEASLFRARERTGQDRHERQVHHAQCVREIKVRLRREAVVPPRDEDGPERECGDEQCHLLKSKLFREQRPDRTTRTRRRERTPRAEELRQLHITMCLERLKSHERPRAQHRADAGEHGHRRPEAWPDEDIERLHQKQRQSDDDRHCQREHDSAERAARDHREPRCDDESIDEGQANREELEAEKACGRDAVGRD